MPTPRLVAIVVTHNRLSHLQVTLARLLDHGTVLAGCVVLNNGSTDDTGRWLAAQSDPRLIVETSIKNLGGAGGFCAAMKAAKRHFDPDWMVLMDDDARPMAGTLHRFLQQPRCDTAAWAPRVTYPNGTLCDMNRPWRNPFATLPTFLRTILRGRDGFHISARDRQVCHIDGASFVGLFVSRAALQRVGYPDPTLFIYGDDVLYTLSITQAGLAMKFDPALEFEHDCETFTPAATMTPLWKVYFYHRNQVTVYRATAGPILFWPLLAMRAALWRYRARQYGTDKPAYLELLNLALRDGLMGRKTHTRFDIEAMITALPKSTNGIGATATSRAPHISTLE